MDIMEGGGYTRLLMDRLRELEVKQDALRDEMAGASNPLPDIYPNVAQIYRRKVERLAAALQHPEDQLEAAEAIRALIERATLIPERKARRDRDHAARRARRDSGLAWG
ncbi:hypothetical protein [Chelativorans sp.]|uniref:hypothetical protein n=1 Tax=Chelativorans sp. TaxID=2203393 RepID=UPI002810F055|nr:hypothetical protein [Chelativorans sp.]